MTEDKNLIIDPTSGTGLNPNKTVHSVFDEASLARQEAGNARDAQRQEVEDYRNQVKNHCRYVQMNQMDDLEHQAGNKMPSEVFVRKLKTLMPNGIRITRKDCTEKECDFLCLPPGTGIMQLSRTKPDGSVEGVASWMDLPYVPEYTLIFMVPKKLPVLRTNFSVHDFPKFEKRVRPTGETDWIPTGPVPTEEWTWEPAAQYPGWRPVLLLCMAAGLVGLGAVEAEFGASDRATWAGKTGKQHLFSEV